MEVHKEGTDMTGIKKTFFRLEHAFDTGTERLILHHQLLGFFLLVVVAPLLTLLAVGVCACVLTMPYFLFTAI